MPKASALVTDLERQIAVRVRRIRERHFLSQPEFAEALGETLDRVASVEYARTPLRVDLADKIARRFGVNLRWLQTGEGQMKPSIGMLSVFYPQIKGSMLFSKSDTSSLEKEALSRLPYIWFSVSAAASGGVVLPRGKKQKELVKSVINYFYQEFSDLPHAGREKLLALIHRTVARFSTDWKLGNRTTPGENITMLPKTLITGPEKKKEVLDIAPLSLDTADVLKIRSLSELIGALKKLTKAHGTKVALAKKCQVSRQAVDQWLSGSAKPSADAVFAAIEWVQDRSKQKQ